MRRTLSWMLVTAVAMGAIGLAVPTGAATLFGRSLFVAGLKSFEEVPSLSTAGSGTFVAVVSRSAPELKYALRYSNLEGENVIFAHIHFGRSATNGGVIAFLCSNVPVPIPTPACPAEGETLTGTLTPADVIGPADQGIAPGEFGELVRALNQRAGYVNVHTDAFPTGEVRGQIH